jgi:hypothetical protein
MEARMTVDTNLAAAPAPAVDLPYSLPLELTVQDSETIAELCAFAEGDAREQFALKALRIGVLAMNQARGQIDTEAIRRESDRLIENMEGRLNEHANLVHERVTARLKEYFDPENGRFQERVERLVKQDGELEVLLRRQIGGEDSELCKTLTAHFGEESELMKLLSPDQSRGLLAAMRQTLDEQLTAQREHVLKQFSLDEKDGALCRFIEELESRQGELTQDLHAKIDDVVKEFSLDEENSALSRLVRNVDRAQLTITKEFSLDDENSALARLKRELLTLLKEQSETNRAFQEEVKVALGEMVARKEERGRSASHGLDFEDAVFECIQREAQSVGDIATRTGNTTGRIKNCKVGDYVVELGPESAAPEVRITIEAKEKDGYQLATARQEIETARKNRDAQVGIFVFSGKTAPEGVKWLDRFGNDVFVIWDAENADTDLYLNVGLSLARFLCFRSKKREKGQGADLNEIDKAILEIEKRAGSLEQIKKWTDTIRSSSEKIDKEVRLSRKSLLKQIEVLTQKMDALKEMLGADDGLV